MHVVKPILVAEIEIIPWCLIFSNLSTPVLIVLKLNQFSLQKDNSGQIGNIVKMKMKD